MNKNMILMQLIKGLFILQLFNGIVCSNETQLICSYNEDDLKKFVLEIQTFSHDFIGTDYANQTSGECSSYLSLMKDGLKRIKDEINEINEMLGDQSYNDNDKTTNLNSNLILPILEHFEHEKFEKQKLKTSLQKHKEKLLEYFSNRMNNNVYDEAEDFLHVIYEGNVENSKIIIDTIADFPDDNLKVSGFEFLYGEMVVNNHLKTFQALYLKCLLKDLAEEAMIFPFTYFEDSYKDHARHIVHNLDGSTKTILEKWNKNILAKKYQEIIELSEEHEHGFDLVLKEFVRYFDFKDKKGVKNLIILANFLPSITHRGVLLSEIYSKITENSYLPSSELIMLAFSVKQAIDLPNFDKLVYAKKRHLTDLKSRIPESLINILWDKICLKNVYTAKYLATEASKLELERNVTMSSEKHSLWMFGTSDFGETFTIKSMGYDEYLIIDENSVQTKLVPVEQADRWTIEPTTSTDIFFIKNLKHSNSYLAVDEENPGHIFAVKMKDLKNQKVIKWEFQKMLQSYFSSFFG